MPVRPNFARSCDIVPFFHFIRLGVSMTLKGPFRSKLPATGRRPRWPRTAYWRSCGLVMGECDPWVGEGPTFFFTKNGTIGRHLRRPEFKCVLKEKLNVKRFFI
jgi:hypothetical protein